MHSVANKMPGRGWGSAAYFDVLRRGFVNTRVPGPWVRNFSRLCRQRPKTFHHKASEHTRSFSKANKAFHLSHLACTVFPSVASAVVCGKHKFPDTTAMN